MKRLKKIMLCAILFFLVGCTKQADPTTNNDDETVVTGFFDKYAIQEKEDGWYAYLYINVTKNDQNSEKMKDNYDIKNISSVFFDIVNLKYQNIDDFYLSIGDVNGNEINKITTIMPSYIQSSLYQEEMRTINQYLTDKKFQEPITLEDLADLETKEIDKNDIVELYNEALKTDPEENVDEQYNAQKEISLKKQQLINGDSIQFAFIDKWNAIGACELEYIYSDGSYLSDLVTSGKADQEQIKLQEQLDNIEEQIENNLPYKEQLNTGNQNLDKRIEEVITTAIKG